MRQNSGDSERVNEYFFRSLVRFLREGQRLITRVGDSTRVCSKSKLCFFSEYRAIYAAQLILSDSRRTTDNRQLWWRPSDTVSGRNLLLGLWALGGRPVSPYSQEQLSLALFMLS